MGWMVMEGRESLRMMKNTKGWVSWVGVEFGNYIWGVRWTKEPGPFRVDVPGGLYEFKGDAEIFK